MECKDATITNMKETTPQNAIETIKKLVNSKDYWLLCSPVPPDAMEVFALQAMLVTVYGDKTTILVTPSTSICFIVRSDTTKNRTVKFPALSFTFVKKSAIPREAWNKLVKKFPDHVCDKDQDIIIPCEDFGLALKIAGLIETFCKGDLRLELMPHGTQN